MISRQAYYTQDSKNGWAVLQYSIVNNDEQASDELCPRGLLYDNWEKETDSYESFWQKVTPFNTISETLTNSCYKLSVEACLMETETSQSNKRT